MTTSELHTAIPAGTWQLDPVHSSVGFELDYMGGSFRGQFREVAAVLAAGDSPQLAGSAHVASVDVKDENLAAHLQSPEFFDAERHPELRFAADEIARDSDALSVRGALTIKGVTRPVELAGTISGPIADPYGKERLGVSVSTSLDRTDFGLDWNLPLPTGEPALANDVTLVAELYFVEAS
jgi:polyisoprenoid-binding protein YceI